MKQLIKCFAILSSLLLLSACNTTQKTITQTKYIKRSVPIQAHPRRVNMKNVKFYVVTESNLDQFLKRFRRANGEVVFVAVSIKDYENLSLNIADLRRYIKQQREIVVYYEKSLTP